MGYFRTLIVCAFLFFISAFCGCTKKEKVPPIFHYLLHAHLATVNLVDEEEGLALIDMEGLRSSVSFFASKPEPRSGAISLRKFFQLWNRLQVHLKQPTLNAVFIYSKEGFVASDFIFDVENIEWDEKKTKMHLVVKGNIQELKARKEPFEQVTLLIDMPTLGVSYEE